MGRDKARYTISKTKEDGLAHRESFIEFSKAELASNGPDSHMNVWVQAHMDETKWVEKAWAIACFCSTYIPASAMAIYANWSPDSIVDDRDKFRAWVKDNKNRLPVRKERRGCWSADGLADAVISFAEFTRRYPEETMRKMSYDHLRDCVMNEVHTVGRYMTMKYMEAMRRIGCIDVALEGVWADNGWSPKLALSYIFPSFDEELNRMGDSDYVSGIADSLAEDLKEELGTTWYQTEVLLCNYRQGLKGRYGGWTHDYELKYILKAINDWFDDVFVEDAIKDLLIARSDIVNHRFLGELNGWKDVRKELQKTKAQHGYWWRDDIYDYARTVDFGKPARHLAD